MKKLPTLPLLVFTAFLGISDLCGQTVHTVVVGSHTFSPANLTIQAGDSVRWTNSSLGFHNVTADDSSFRCANGCDGMGGNGDPAANLWTFTLAFDTPGTIPYFCEIHGGAGGSGMSGTITVQGAAPPSCTNLTSPANGATNVAVTADLTWTAATGNPTGYRLDVGTAPGGTDILNNFDAGNVTTYNPPGDFPYNATIYVNITPYNAGGDAADCPEESFSTQVCIPNLLITSIPIPSGNYMSMGILTSHTSTVAGGSTVVFTSDTGVLLDHDFTVDTGGDFGAFIQACPNNIHLPSEEK